MNVLILAPSDIYPVNNGASMRIFDTANSLSKFINVDVYSPKYRLPAYQGKGFIPKENKFRYIYIDTQFDKFVEKLPSSNILTKFLLYFRPWLWIYLIRRREQIPDIIHVEHMFSFLNGILLKKIWDRPLVLVVHNVEHLIIKKIYGNIPGKIAYYINKIAIRNSDKVVCVSDVDKEILIREFRAKNIDVIPNSINIDMYQSRGNITDEIRSKIGIKIDDKIVFFHGLLSYPPNRESIEIISKCIAPKVLYKNKNVKFLIVGPNPPCKCIGDKNIIFTNAVEDIASYIHMADVCIVCLKSGSGTRLKILEYMACKKPIISTSKGVEGIDIENNRDIIIIDEWDEFSQKITQLLDDKSKRTILGNNARRLVESSYNWDINVQAYIDIYNKLIKG